MSCEYCENCNCDACWEEFGGRWETIEETLERRKAERKRAGDR